MENAIDAYKGTRKIRENIFTGGILMKEGLLKDIRDSVKISIPDVSIIDTMFDTFEGTPSFRGRSKVEGGLPFESCWFEYDMVPGNILCGGGMIVKECDKINRIISVVPFFKHNDNIQPMMVSIYINLNEGSYVFNPLSFAGMMILREGDMRQIHGISAVLNFTLLLLECKNIVTENMPSSPKNKRKRGGIKTYLPRFTYKTLKVVVGGNKKPSNGSGINSDNHNRQHLCRGHFKTFTEDKPLLGRAIGRYWWQSSVRGRADMGVIEKDYELKFGK